MGGKKQYQEETDESEEEEYEVQRIADHKIVYTGKKKTPSLQFQIKWKGYPESDNTWEPENATDHCQELVDEYWNGLSNGKAARKRVEKILSGGLRESDEEEEDDEEFEVAPKKKQAPAAASKKRRAASPKKKTAAAATSSSKRRRTTANKRKDASSDEESEEEIVPQFEEEEEEEESREDEDINESDIEPDFRIKSNNWTKEVSEVFKVRTGTNEDNQQELYGIVRWRDGKLGIYKTSFLKKKIPQLLIEYYEKRLTFEAKE